MHSRHPTMRNHASSACPDFPRVGRRRPSTAASITCTFAALVATAGLATQALGQNTGVFVNFESPQVHPLDITPDGQTLLAANTADGQLEVFSIIAGLPVRRGSVAVGVDPVSVRARSNGEAWVVNQVSDSVSVVDLATMRVVRTIAVGDEPADVVFAGAKSPRAFVSLAASNRVVAFDPNAVAPVFATIPISGAQPRALAVSPGPEHRLPRGLRVGQRNDPRAPRRCEQRRQPLRRRESAAERGHAVRSAAGGGTAASTRGVAHRAPQRRGTVDGRQQPQLVESGELGRRRQ